MNPIPDAGRVLKLMCAIARFDGDPGDGGLPPEGLELLARLVPCDNLWVSGQDTRRWEFFLEQTLVPVRLSPADEAGLSAAYARFYWQSDCSYPDRTGDVVSVLRASDRVGRLARRRDPMDAEYNRPLGIKHEVRVVLGTSEPQRTVRLILVRTGDPDFSDREVTLLAILRPHLQALWTSVERARQGGRGLTPRQQVVVRMAAQGATNCQIASRLGIAEGTVRKHLENAYARLQVSNRMAAAAALPDPGSFGAVSRRTG